MILWFIPAKFFSVLSRVIDAKTEKIKRTKREEKNYEGAPVEKNPVWTDFYQELDVLDSYLSEEQKNIVHHSLANFLDFTLYIEQERSDDIMRLLTLIITAANCMNGRNDMFPQMFIHFVISETFDQIKLVIEDASRSDAHKTFAFYEIYKIGGTIGVMPNYESNKKGEEVWLKSQ